MKKQQRLAIKDQDPLDGSSGFGWSMEQKQKALQKISILMGFLLLVASLNVIYAGCS